MFAVCIVYSQLAADCAVYEVCCAMCAVCKANYMCAVGAVYDQCDEDRSVYSIQSTENVKQKCKIEEEDVPPKPASSLRAAVR